MKLTIVSSAATMALLALYIILVKNTVEDDLNGAAYFVYGLMIMSAVYTFLAALRLLAFLPAGTQKERNR